MDKNKTPSEILGYHFIIFQDNFRGYVKCWIDGSENYTYFTEKDFIGMVSSIDPPGELIINVKSCLDTTGIYVWDVDNHSISRLKSSYEKPSIVQEINKLNPFSGKSRF